MQTNTLIKWIVLGLLIAISAILVIPPKDKIRLGLDIKGGSSFTVELDTAALWETIAARLPENTPTNEIASRVAAARQNADEVAVEIIRARLNSIGTEEPVITRGGNGRIYVQIPGASAEQRARAERMVRSVAFLDFRLVHPQSQERAQRLLDSGRAPNGYVVSLDGEYYVREDGTNSPLPAAEMRSFGNPPAGAVFMMERVPRNADIVYRPIFVNRRPLLTGESISRADTSNDNFGRPEVLLNFNAEGTREFSDITARYCPNGRSNANPVGRQLAIVLDDVVYSAPVIQERIPGGTARISGSFSIADARELKNVLNAGAMPAPLKFLGSSFVSPTLGADAISGAKTSIVVGLAAILVFFVVYYRYMGLVAYGAIVLNLALLPLCAVIASNILAIFTNDATQTGGSIASLPVLTLPGIAGILLTLGMAADANILIYERTREEQALGRPPFPSIMAGYQRAFLAIFDGNLTTVITAVILFIFGTGVIRGFAVTLVAGIIASMYTALVVTKMVFRATVKESASKPMAMMTLFPKRPDIQFHAYFKPFSIAAAAVIIVTLGLTVARGLRNPASVFGVDFTGGTKVSYSVKSVDAEADRAALLSNIGAAARAAGFADAAPQYMTADGGAAAIVEIKTVKTGDDGVEISGPLTEALQSAESLKDAGVAFIGEDSIGSQVGAEMKRSALWAVLLSTAAMLLYIGFRFEWGFGLGAIVALAHDVLITIGIFACLGFQFDLTIVAAMLTIVGYGVNDTIVLFDRVREEMKRDSRTPFPELANRCVNATLSRTVLTSLTTLIAVVALLIFAKGDIRGFAACMFIGIIVSTFSSIYIATPVMLAYYRNKRPAAPLGAGDMAQRK